jgi:hypothetical protein
MTLTNRIFYSQNHHSPPFILFTVLTISLNYLVYTCLTTGILSEKCIVRLFHHDTNIIEVHLHKPRGHRSLDVTPSCYQEMLKHKMYKAAASVTQHIV